MLLFGVAIPEYNVPMAQELDERRRCVVVTISESYVAETDASGALVAQRLRDAGHEVLQQRWLKDDLLSIRYLVRSWVDDDRVDVIVAIGGTGLDSTDVTPEAIAPIISKQMPGFGEIFRFMAFERLGMSALESRAMAAVCHSTLVYLIPGDPTAVELAMDRLIVPQLGERIPTERLTPTMMPKRSSP